MTTTTRGAGKDPEGRPAQKLVSPSTVNRTLQCLRATLYHVRDNHEASIRPGLKFGVTKEPERVREASDAEEAAILATLREDFHPIFAFALLTGIRETGVCTVTWRNVDFRNSQVTFQGKRRRTDPPGFIRWETQPLTELECDLLRSLKRHHTEFVFTYTARGKKGGKGATGQGASYEKDKRYPSRLRR